MRNYDKQLDPGLTIDLNLGVEEIATRHLSFIPPWFRLKLQLYFLAYHVFNLFMRTEENLLNKVLNPKICHLFSQTLDYTLRLGINVSHES